MATTNITMRMDERLKADLQELVSNLGMDLTTFFTIAAKQAVREQKMPFLPSMEVPNIETLKAMAEVDYMIEHPEARGKGYENAESMMEDLLG